jgi:hypothetical protein
MVVEKDPITISFTMQKYINYDNTANLIFKFKRIETSKRIYFRGLDSTFWELTGLI